MRLLHIDSSLHGDASVSRTIGAAIVARLRATHDDLTVTYRDLDAEPLPHLSQNDLATLADNASLAQFLAADMVVIGAPLYNFSVSTPLKAWIDRILVAGRTFRYSEGGPEGLAGEKRIIVALARGAPYAEGSPFAAWEHAETLLRTVFGFIGIAEPEFVIAEGLALGDEVRRVAVADALDAAGRIDTAPRAE